MFLDKYSDKISTLKDPNTEEHAVAAEERAGSAEKELIALLLTTGACINNSQFHIPIQIVMDFGKANQYECKCTKYRRHVYLANTPH